MYYSGEKGEGRRQRRKGPPDLLSSLLKVLQPSSRLDALPSGPAVAHRLDKGTGGIVLCVYFPPPPSRTPNPSAQTCNPKA